MLIDTEVGCNARQFLAVIVVPHVIPRTFSTFACLNTQTNPSAIKRVKFFQTHQNNRIFLFAINYEFCSFAQTFYLLWNRHIITLKTT